MFARPRVPILSAIALFLGCAGHEATVSKARVSAEADKTPGKNQPAVKDTASAIAEPARKHIEDSLRALNIRQESIQEWSNRVRSTVEPYWVLPKVLVKHKYRSVARIRAARSGNILNVTWVEKSRSTVFNNLAAKALKKVKHLPPFPSAIPDTVLEIQYEFITPGIAPPRHKLELRKTGSPEAF